MLRMANTTHNLIIFYGQWACNGQSIAARTTWRSVELSSRRSINESKCSFLSWAKFGVQAPESRVAERGWNTDILLSMENLCYLYARFFIQCVSFAASANCLPLSPALPCPAAPCWLHWTLTPQLRRVIVAHTPRMPPGNGLFIGFNATVLLAFSLVGNVVKTLKYVRQRQQQEPRHYRHAPANAPKPTSLQGKPSELWIMTIVIIECMCVCAGSLC